MSQNRSQLDRFASDSRCNLNERSMAHLMNKVASKLTQIDIRLNANEIVSKNICLRLNETDQSCGKIMLTSNWIRDSLA